MLRIKDRFTSGSVTCDFQRNRSGLFFLLNAPSGPQRPLCRAQDGTVCLTLCSSWSCGNWPPHTHMGTRSLPCLQPPTALFPPGLPPNRLSPWTRQNQGPPPVVPLQRSLAPSRSQHPGPGSPPTSPPRVSPPQPGPQPACLRAFAFPVSVAWDAQKHSRHLRLHTQISRLLSKAPFQRGLPKPPRRKFPGTVPFPHSSSLTVNPLKFVFLSLSHPQHKLHGDRLCVSRGLFPAPGTGLGT